MDEYIGFIETEQESCIFIVKRENMLLAGTATNTGMFETYKMEIDNDFSIDQNLQEFIEIIEEGEKDVNI